MRAIFPVLLGVTFLSAAEPAEEKIRYLRLTANGTALETTIAIHKMADGWKIVSTTERGGGSLVVMARYDAGDKLVAATVEQADKDDAKKAAQVAVKDGKVRVTRATGATDDFDAPAGVIVTSAPDWTDTFLLCRRYDRAKGGKQEFAALWAHPEQMPLRPTFSVERQGQDTIEHDGKKLTLDRLSIRIRNNSPYLGWADDQGRMIKLAGLPFKEGSSVELVRAGFEKSAAKLRP